jgi:ribosomal protein S18 acetylase RimI-like enzyme
LGLFVYSELIVTIWLPLNIILKSYFLILRSISFIAREELRMKKRRIRSITTTPIIKTATESDEEGVIDVIMRAFATDPAARWSWPDSQQYFMHFPSFVKAVGGKAFTKGTAYYVDDGYAAAALWLPPNIHPDEDKLTSLVQHTVSEQIQKDFLSVFEQMGHYHPSEPHWFLPFMGVDPSQQGQGFGSALLQHTLIQCDRDSELVYLESTNPKNIPLYQRHGFEVLGTIQVGTSPSIFPMLRRPR